jgi:hypothetical protein
MSLDAVPGLVKEEMRKAQISLSRTAVLHIRIESRSADYGIGPIQTRLRFQRTILKQNFILVYIFLPLRHSNSLVLSRCPL